MSEVIRSEGRGDMARAALGLLEDNKKRRALAGVDPSSVRTLLAAAQQACSLEELEIILRYQQARLRGGWTEEVVGAISMACTKAADAICTGDLSTADADRARACAAAEQLALIARVHRVAHAEVEGQGRGGPRGGRR